MFKYTARRTRFLPNIEINGCKLKPYEIFYNEDLIAEKVNFEILQQKITDYLQKPNHDKEHGCGFMIIHYGYDGNYLLLSQWFGGNMLQHRAFQLLGNKEDLTLNSLESLHIIACVWELKLINFERDAWVNLVMLSNGTEKSFEDYLNLKFTGDV